jgi:D-3-phosphoglycerate dehydrogenase / 2-oxoglutarate reductase
MARVLVTEEIADSGLEALRAAGHDVDIQLGLSEDQLLETIPGATALIIRSSTQVTPAVLKAARDLVVVGRAGIGLDNVDVSAATAQGVMVVNAPQSNIISAAEHALALLMAQARNVAQADAALKAGRWERSKWEGVELYGKTLGIVGLGRIGALVAQRIVGFGMRVVAYDPYVSAERAAQLGVELMDLETLMANSDFITVHLPKTPETVGLIGKDMLAKAKAGMRVVNAARGGIVDEEALAEAIRSGHIQGAGLDVFSTEPCTDSPLFELPSVVATPHLGASTVEAQDKAGVTIAEQVGLALAGEFVPFAVNINASEASDEVKPFLGLAETLGRSFAALTGGRTDNLEVAYRGKVSEQDTRILTLAVLKGFFGANADEPVSYVNAPQFANDRGLDVQETKGTVTRKYVSMLVVRNGEHSIGGTVTGKEREPKLVMIDDYEAEVPPADHMLIVRNNDTPGIVATVAGTLADNKINIADMSLCRSVDRTHALMVITTDDEVSDKVRKQIQDANPGVIGVEVLSR